MITSFPVNRLRKHKIRATNSSWKRWYVEPYMSTLIRSLLYLYCFSKVKTFLRINGSRWKPSDSTGTNDQFLLNRFFNSSRGRIKKMGRPWGQVVEKWKEARRSINLSISSLLNMKFPRIAE